MSGLGERRRSESGFTLIEVAAAVLLLGLALTTLIGLQVNLMSSYTEERNRTRAALYAQYLMTILEVSSASLDEGEQQLSLEAALDQAGYFDDDVHIIQERKEITNWDYIKTVQGLEVPMVGSLLKRIDLAVRWGETEDESYTLTYFIKQPPAAAAGLSAPSP